MMTPRRQICHLDLDAFYAQVETQRLGLSDDVPLALLQHNLLLAVNYAARKFGVPSRCDVSVALKACPALKVVEIEMLDGIKPSLTRYREASARVMTIVKRLVPDERRVERASIDEAYLDLSSLFPTLEVPFESRPDVHVYGDEFEARKEYAAASRFVCELRDCVKRELGYTMSAGVSCNKLCAKMASARFKPDSQTLVAPSAVRDLLLSCKSVHKVPGLGGKLGHELVEALGCEPEAAVRAVQDLCRSGTTWGVPKILADRFGQDAAEWIVARLHGVDESAVVERMKPKSLLSSKSFSQPIFEKPKLDDWISLQARELSQRLLSDFTSFSRVPHTLTVHFRGKRVGSVTRQRPVHFLDAHDSPGSAQIIVDTANVLLKALPLPCSGLGLALTNFDDVDAKQPSMTAFFKPDSAATAAVVEGSKTAAEVVEEEEEEEEDDWSNSAAAAPAAAAAAAAGPLHPQTSREVGTDEFVAKFFRASRLSFIGSWKRRWESILDTIPDCGPLPVSRLPGGERVVLHVDMDAFFCTASLLDKPHLASQPMAVCWGGEAAEISSCNYAARAKGLRAGMFMARAKTLCPEVQTVPFEFERYQDIGEKVMRALLEVSPQVEAISCDEAFVDVTACVHAFEEVPGLCARVKAVIRAASGGCTATVGAGPTRVVARVVCRSAKPDGAKYLRGEAEVLAWLGALQVRDLPSVGRATAAKLTDLPLVCDVQGASVEELQALLGRRTGEMVRELALGRDPRPWAPRPVRRSVSAQISWGVRMDTLQEVHAFLARLAEEAVARLRPGASGSQAGIKVWRAFENQPDKMRKGTVGHGLCDVVTRSVGLASRVGVGAHMCLALACQLMFEETQISAEEVRGLGVALSGLDDEAAAAQPSSSISGGSSSSSRPAGGSAAHTSRPAAKAGARTKYEDEDVLRLKRARAEQDAEARLQHEVRRAFEDFYCLQPQCAGAEREVCLACLDRHLDLVSQAGLLARGARDADKLVEDWVGLPEGHVLQVFERLGGGVQLFRDMCGAGS